MFGDISPYFSEHVRRDLKAKFGSKELYEKGLHVETTILPWVDAVAAENVDFGTRKLDKRQGWRRPRARAPPEEELGVVAHLAGNEAEAFLARAETRYGDGPLEPGRRYLGLVENVKADGARVRVGAREYPLPISQMRWAATFTTKDATNDRTASARATCSSSATWSG